MTFGFERMSYPFSERRRSQSSRSSATFPLGTASYASYLQGLIARNSRASPLREQAIKQLVNFLLQITQRALVDDSVIGSRDHFAEPPGQFPLLPEFEITHGHGAIPSGSRFRPLEPRLGRRIDCDDLQILPEACLNAFTSSGPRVPSMTTSSPPTRGIVLFAQMSIP